MAGRRFDNSGEEAGGPGDPLPRALTSSEARLEAILEGAPIFVLVCDAAGVVTHFSGGTTTFRRNPGELLGRTVFELYPNASEGLAGTRSALAGEATDATVRVLDRWWQVHLTPQRSAEGEVVGMTAIGTDVTARVEAEERLRERDDFSRAILDALPSATVVIDYEGRVLAANHAWSAGIAAGGADPSDFGVGSLHRDSLGLFIADEDLARQAQEGIVRVVAGEHAAFYIDYPRPRGADDQWFSMRVTPFAAGNGAVVSHVDITERKRVEGAYSFQALHDGLTGLPNRVLLCDRAAIAMARSPRRRTACALLFIDLDRFKMVNDSLGHGAGDVVLFEVAARLRSVCRPEDTVARVGGDEFCVLCEDLEGPHAAEEIARRLIASIAEPIMLGDREVGVGASVGIALSHEGDADVDALLRDADAAMYRAKLLGRSRWVVFDETMRRDALDRLEVEHGLRRALERDELLLHYQPVVDLRSRRIIGVEALVRWHRPGHGTIRPASFMGVAEEAGLMERLAGWILPEACRQVREWRDLGDQRVANLRLSVNVAATELLRPGLAGWAAAVLAEVGLPGSALALEITETALVHDFDRAAEVLAQLKRLGIAVGVDDFGTGYASLSSLHRLSVDFVKVDGALVAGLDGDQGTLVTAVIQLGAALGLEVVAEGIETGAQLDMLISLGCFLGQGFLLGAPDSAAAITELLLAQPVDGDGGTAGPS